MKNRNYIFIISIALGILMTSLCGLLIFHNNHDYQQIAIDIDPTKPMVALTFDDGPNEDYTPKVLDILLKYQAYATFCINGKNIVNNEELLKKMVYEGHELANHTFSHYDLTTLNKEEIKDEIAKNQAEVFRVLPEYKLQYIRPPYGHYNEDVIDAMGMAPLLWDIDSGDWEEPNAEAIYNTVMNNISDGDIVIFHDDNPETIKALNNIIPALQKKGFQLVTVSQLTHESN